MYFRYCDIVLQALTYKLGSLKSNKGCRSNSKQGSLPLCTYLSLDSKNTEKFTNLGNAKDKQVHHVM